jgi:hypothetical protein
VERSKVVRWSAHALQTLVDREIDREVADATLATPELAVSDESGRRILMRQYFDEPLQREMLLRVVIEDTASEIVVVTLYKTSRIETYLRGPGR